MKRKNVHRRRNDPPSYRVFVSHATKDKWLAKTICEKLEGSGVESFRDDRDIAGGNDIPETIRQAIVHSQELLVLLTPESVNRPWVILELGAAWGRGKAVVAILCHVATDQIPDIIKQRKALNLNDFDVYLKELAQRARR